MDLEKFTFVDTMSEKIKLFLVQNLVLFELKFLFDSGLSFFDVWISDKLVDNFGLDVNSLEYIDLLLLEGTMKLINWESRRFVSSKKIPHGYDIVFGRNFMNFLFENNIVVGPYRVNVELEKQLELANNEKLVMIPFVSNGQHEMFFSTISLTDNPTRKLSVLFDTGSISQYDMMLCRDLANELVKESVLVMSGKIIGFWRIDQHLEAEVGKIDHIYFVHNSVEYRIDDVVVNVEKENVDCGGIYYDLTISCKLIERLFIKYGIIVCATK